MAIVVDTDVVSYLFKSDTRAKAFEPHLLNTPKFISFMTLAELLRWRMQSNWGSAKKEKFGRFLNDFGVIYADDLLCEVWAELTLNCQQIGKPIAVADAWVAAVALMFEVPLLTNNRRHFENVPHLTIL